MVPVVAEPAAPAPAARENVGLARAGKQQAEGVINDSHSATALEEGGGRGRGRKDPGVRSPTRRDSATWRGYRGSIIVSGNRPRALEHR